MNMFFDKAVEEANKSFSAVGFKDMSRNLKYKEHQTGKTNKSRDKERKALLAGKRVSSKGNIYYEYRKNRSDLKGSRI